MMRLFLPLLTALSASAQIRLIGLPAKSPLVNFRIVFTVGAAADPEDKPGLAYLTAQMLGDAGSKDMTYREIVDALFPMASGVSVQVDKEMTALGGSTHVENLDPYYKLLRAAVLQP